MKLRTVVPAALFAMAAAAPALAQTYYVEPAPPSAYPGGTIYVPAVRPGGLLHGGWVAPGDDQLLGDTMAALEAERGMDGANLTIVAKNGELIINGKTKDPQQAARVDSIAKRVAHGHVSSRYDTYLG